MDRQSLSLAVLAIAVFFLFATFFGKGCNQSSGTNYSVVRDADYPLPLTDARPGEPSDCVVETPTFRARVSGRGGGLLSYELKGPKYVEDGHPVDLTARTTRDAAGRVLHSFTPLRTYFRNDLNAETQVPGDLVEFHVESQNGACILTHRTPEQVELRRVLKATSRPYELEAETTVTNLAAGPRKHAFSTAVFALQLKAQEGGMFTRPSPQNLVSAACGADGAVDIRQKDKLRQWFVRGGRVDFAAVSNTYTGQIVAPLDDGAHCALVGQERGDNAEAVLFHAAVSYAPRELAPSQSATYRQLAYLGPKDKPVLAAAGGGRHFDKIIDLGTFAIIVNVLVWFLGFAQGALHSWGLAIILLTVTVRLALLPLTIPQVRSAISMRRLKPALDKINADYADNAQAKMEATSRLYREHKINPLLGCLPALAQMPVWIALYTALQNAMELYHEPFFIWGDLSAPDPRFVLPLILGATMFLQQQITPMQMDPAQQKVFLYFMPAMFTVFMLFLPAGLGVYMLTNSILSITQTLVVEQMMKRVEPISGADVRVREARPAEKKT